MSIRELQIQAQTAKGLSGAGKVWIEEWDEKQRSKRALRLLATLWGMAIGSIILPLAHFFLVPGFFIAGPIAAWFTYRQTSRIDRGETQCPACHAPLKVARVRPNWPVRDVCSKCHEEILLSPLVESRAT